MKSTKFWMVAEVLVCISLIIFAVVFALQDRWYHAAFDSFLALNMMWLASLNFKKLKRLKADATNPPRYHGGHHSS